MANRRHRARVSDFAVVLKRGGRGWNTEGQVVRRYELPGDASVHVCGRSIMIEGSGWDPDKGVILRVEELAELIELLDIWKSRRASWFEFHDQTFMHHCITSVRRPGETKWRRIDSLPSPESEERDDPPGSFARGDVGRISRRKPRACTDRFAHVADLVHKGEARLGPAPAKVGEVYADPDGLHVFAYRDGFMLTRGGRETRGLSAKDLRGLRLLADLEASRMPR